VVTAWWQVLPIRFVDRLAKGIRGTPRDVMVAESAGPRRLGSAYGLLQSMDSAGAIVGPLAALILLARWGVRGVFWAAVVPGALCVLVALFGIRETSRRYKASDSGNTEHNHGKNVVDSAATPSIFAGPALPAKYYIVLVAVGLFSLANSSDMFLVLRAENIGMSAGLAPLLGLVLNLTYTLFSWPAGWLSDRFSRRGIAAAGYVIFAGVYFVFGQTSSTLAIWITMAVYGIYNALTQPVLKALVVEAVDHNVRGRALGIYFFVTSIATLAASLITGELWKQYGPSVPFYVSAGLAVVSAGLLLLSRIKRGK
jgi:MFS family permease